MREKQRPQIKGDTFFEDIHFKIKLIDPLMACLEKHMPGLFTTSKRNSLFRFRVDLIDEAIAIHALFKLRKDRWISRYLMKKYAAYLAQTEGEIRNGVQAPKRPGDSVRIMKRHEMLAREIVDIVGSFCQEENIALACSDSHGCSQPVFFQEKLGNTLFCSFPKSRGYCVPEKGIFGDMVLGFDIEGNKQRPPARMSRKRMEEICTAHECTRHRKPGMLLSMRETVKRTCERLLREDPERYKRIAAYCQNLKDTGKHVIWWDDSVLTAFSATRGIYLLEYFGVPRNQIHNVSLVHEQLSSPCAKRKAKKINARNKNIDGANGLHGKKGPAPGSGSAKGILAHQREEE